MDKEDLLRKIVPNSCYWEDNFDNIPQHYIHSAMDEFAKSTAIGFAEFILSKHYEPFGNKWTNNMLKTLTTEELYSLYLTQQK